MIVLNTNAGLKTTFERLIKAMKAPVEWNGRFVVLGDFLILHGRVRSLFFSFEGRMVQTNLIDLPVKEEEVIEIGERSNVQNVLNLTLYAFGKWGMIRGIKVEQDYAQLNTLFTGVLREISVEPGYSRENFRFYKAGIRLSYEDVVAAAIESSENTEEQTAQSSESVAGLWHKLIWQKQKFSFQKNDVAFEERQKNRLGNNFYMVSYHCPKCREHLHMTVFPEGKEFRIETTEGGVFLARAYACETCKCFYTPRPNLLLSEGDVYIMDFHREGQAYEDYKELLGSEGALTSNYKFNEFEAVRKRKSQLQISEERESLDSLCRRIGQVTDRELAEMAGKIEEGFFPAGSVERFGDIIQKEVQKRRVLKSVDRADETERRTKESADRIRQETLAEKRDLKAVRIGPVSSGATTADRRKAAGQEVISASRREAAKKRYAAKCGILHRLSPVQVVELKNELIRDKNLYKEEKEKFLNQIKEKETQQKKDRIRELSQECREKGYGKIRYAIEEIEKMEMPEEEKKTVLAPFYAERKKCAEAEVQDLINRLPKQMNVKQYHTFLDRLKSYPEADLSPYKELLNERKKDAERREVSRMMRHAQNADRPGLIALIENLKKQPYEQDVLESALGQLEEKLYCMDEDALAQLCNHPGMTAEEMEEAYHKIEEGEFLPELKTNALNQLKRRLEKLKMEECDLLVHKFQNDLDGRISPNDRHHFYPAGKVLEKEIQPEEYKEIQYALDTYGMKRGIFEYPIFTVDTSRDRSGKEGMILTPEHLFYRTMLNAYFIPVGEIKNIHSQTGLLKTGLFVERQNGTRIKIPYAVNRKELTAWGNCLEEFIRYLQEKPESRNLSYLAKEKHETICCFRCGYTYKGGSVCPKCGYKRNQ